MTMHTTDQEQITLFLKGIDQLKSEADKFVFFYNSEGTMKWTVESNDCEMHITNFYNGCVSVIIPEIASLHYSKANDYLEFFGDHNDYTRYCPIPYFDLDPDVYTYDEEGE